MEMAMSHRIQKGEMVYSEPRKVQGLQPNGVVTYVVQEDGEPTDIQVKWLSDRPEYEYLPFECFDGTWNVNFRDTWYLLAD
jgi:hypothetical protein